MKDLYRLIHSLDRNEKKYFRRFGLKDDSKGKSNTEALFEVLDEELVYDEERIMFRLRRAKLDKQIAQLERYLFEVLSESMVWYNRWRTPGFATAFDLATVHLYEDRGLDDRAQKLSVQTVQHTLQKGSFMDKWNALGKSIHYASNAFLGDRKATFAGVSDLVEQRSVLLDQMQRYHQYDTLLVQQLGVMRKAMQARSNDDLAALQHIYEQPVVQQVSMANSHDARFVFHTLRLHHYHILNRWKDLYKEALALVKYINTNEADTFEAMRVLWAYAQLTQACYFNAKWKELEQYLNELNALACNNQTERIAQFTYYTQLAITVLDMKSDTDALLDTITQTVTNLKTYKDRLRPDIRLAMTITCVSAYAEYGKYSAALDICEDFLTNYDSGVRLDALLMLYVYEFICHLEMGNMLYVNNTIQNVSRYFLRNDHKGEFETVLMKVFKKLSEVSDHSSIKPTLKKLQKELDEAAKATVNQQHLSLLPIVQGFVSAKLQRMKLHEYAAAQKRK